MIYFIEEILRCDFVPLFHKIEKWLLLANSKVMNPLTRHLRLEISHHLRTDRDCLDSVRRLVAGKRKYSLNFRNFNLNKQKLTYICVCSPNPMIQTMKS